MSDAQPSRPLRILHLEDSPRDAAVVRDKLDVARVSCDILLVNSKNSFEAALRREPFDLIISDYTLPGYDGVAALKQAQEAQPEVPVILISGTVGEEEAVKCLHIGATDYLLKTRLERLVPAVQRALQEAETRRTRKRAEGALRESEARKAAILDSVLDGIVTMDANGVVLEFNAAAAQIFRYTKAEAIGRPLADLIVPPAYRARHRAGLAHYVATGEGPLIGRLIEITAVRADGSEIPVELAITAVGSGQDSIFTGVLRDITARKHADATRARLAAIVDSSDDAIFTVALDDTILTWNAGAERLYGYVASEMIDRSRGLLVAPGKREELVRILERAVRGDASPPFETQGIRKDGSVVDVSLVISPMTDSGAQVTSVSMIARDITERRRAETAVRGERDRAQRYLDTADVILLSLDLDGRITLVNRYACSLLGWTCDELIGRDFIETCLPVRTRDALRQTFHNVLAGDVSKIENPVLSRFGEERLIEWRNITLRDDVGRPTGTLSSGADVTERNQAVEALRQAEERMRFALQSANVGIWDMDYTSGVLRWSDAMAAQYGLQPGTFDETFDGFVERIHPDDRASVLETVGKAMASGTDFSVSHRALWPDGTVRWMSGAGRILLGEGGVAVRGVGISQDVTARRTLEEQYQQAQKMEAIGRLAGGVAHDFNNLLTVILGFCELLLSDLDPADARQADIAEIQKAGARAAALTRQLLAFSRKEIIEPIVLDLNLVVTDIRILLERLIGEDVKVVLSLGRALALVKADRGQMEQVILNLAVNARDAMPKGGTLTIETSNIELDEHCARAHSDLAAGPYVALTVTDTGTGMTHEVQARLFEPFFTTKGVGKGTGLGLATVHGIATRGGGVVTVDSALGRGTSFTVYFPCADVAAMVAVPVPPLAPPRVKRHTVLVVEDAESLGALTRRPTKRATCSKRIRPLT
jgi:two-component system cell cycle sensor histidine kinase/response regulator CckA